MCKLHLKLHQGNADTNPAHITVISAALNKPRSDCAAYFSANIRHTPHDRCYVSL
jgi:hypothetical protein